MKIPEFNGETELLLMMIILLLKILLYKNTILTNILYPNSYIILYLD